MRIMCVIVSNKQINDIPPISFISILILINLIDAYKKANLVNFCKFANNFINIFVKFINSRKGKTKNKMSIIQKITISIVSSLIMLANTFKYVLKYCFTGF